MEYKIILRGRIPSKKNGKQWVQRGGRRFLVSSDEHQAWHTEQINKVKRQWGRNETLQRVQAVRIDFTAPDRRTADLTNKAESVMDLLKDAHVYKDDNWFVVPSLILNLIHVSKDSAGAVITIIV